MTREEAIFCEKSYLGETNCTDCKYYGTETCQSRESHRMAIKALEQEPRKGHWIETAEEYYKAINEKGGGVNDNTPYFVEDIACSECLAKFCIVENEVERFDFCPACGADMRGEK